MNCSTASFLHFHLAIKIVIKKSEDIFCHFDPTKTKFENQIKVHI